MSALTVLHISSPEAVKGFQDVMARIVAAPYAYTVGVLIDHETSTVAFKLNGGVWSVPLRLAEIREES